jgi:hypothetical protein
MGITGAGKSTFIQKVTGREDIQIGHNLTSGEILNTANVRMVEIWLTLPFLETIECRSYSFEHADIKMALVDTPGFNDTYLDDAAILAQLSSFMETTYRAQVKLTAIIYLHPITNDRLEGSALDNLSLFRKLCGPKFYPNVILATTFWSKVDTQVGSRREAELMETEEFWGSMCNRGSEVIRLPDDQESCIKLLLRLANKPKVSLQIQEELVDQGLSIGKTAAGASAKNIRALEALREEFNQRMDSLATQKKAELVVQEAELTRLRDEQEQAFQQQLRKNKQELERTRLEHQKLLAQTEEKQRKLLDEQAEIVRRTQAETEAARAELEKLTIKDKIDQEERERKRKEQSFEASMAVAFSTLKAQFELFSSALSARTVKQFEIKTDFYYDLRLSLYCSVCLRQCSTLLSYCEFPSLVLWSKLCSAATWFALQDIPQYLLFADHTYLHPV